MWGGGCPERGWGPVILNGRLREGLVEKVKSAQRVEEAGQEAIGERSTPGSGDSMCQGPVVESTPVPGTPGVLA